MTGAASQGSFWNRTLVITLTCIVVGGATLPAQAGYHRGHGYGWGGYDHYYDGYHSHRHHRHRYHRRSDRRAAYLAGGLLLGSLITHAAYAHKQRALEPRYEHRPLARGSASSSPPVSRRLLLDRDGNCFERQRGANGAEVLLELNPTECAW